MTDGNIELTRRKILASAGAIGAAGAAAGLGTSAYFSDTEEFANNRLVAGELDLKVDWEEHYSDWSDDETDGGVDATMDEPGSPGDYYGFPVGAEETDLWVNTTDDTGDGRSSVERFMDNTSVEAYPDEDDDGIQDDFPEDDVCSNDLLANTPEDLDPTSSARTYNPPGSSARGEATVDSDDEPLPLIDIEDIKPGDFGEVTFSFHLCDNPGYVWLQGLPVTAAEGGRTEPEREDDDEAGDADESYDVDNGDTVTDILDSDVELLDAIQTAWWYDTNCNNRIDGGTEESGGGGQADIVFVIDASGSIAGDERPDIINAITGSDGVAQQLIDEGLDAQFAVVDYVQDAAIDQDLTDDLTQLEAELTNGPASGIGSFTENLSKAILFASNNVSLRPSAKTIYVGITDEPDQSSSQQKTDAVDEINNTDSAFLGIAESTNQISELLNGVNQSRFSTFMEGNISAPLQDLAGFAGGVTGGGEEPVEGEGDPNPLFRGSLRTALEELSSGNGFPLDARQGVPLQGTIPAEEGGGTDGSCFEAETTHCIGFSWWLPVDHANEIQTDSVGFDLGFYTEQCRHNDGGGQFGNARQVGNN